ncbi:MAG: molybdopterin molybdenumtransferase MoeA, partial [Euryarchaeota archaeon]|nr:molybdopterin molybdenumtransferase MoeA [Euryarchaeota archaeon]
MGVRKRGFRERTPVGAALEILLSTAKALGTDEVGLEKACGRVLAEDLVSSMDLPPFPRAAMDGYAVKGEDTFGASQG